MSSGCFPARRPNSFQTQSSKARKEKKKKKKKNFFQFFNFFFFFLSKKRLLSTHTQLLRQLRRAKTARQLSAHLIRVAKDFEAYAVYVSNFATAISTLHAAAPRVQAALNECEANASAEVSFQNFTKEMICDD
jgi:hypothetical protein